MRAEVAAAGAAALDHLVDEAGTPLPVVDDLGPSGDLAGEAPQRRQALVIAELGSSISSRARATAAGIAAAQVADLSPSGRWNIWPSSGNAGCLDVARLGEVLELVVCSSSKPVSER